MLQFMEGKEAQLIKYILSGSIVYVVVILAVTLTALFTGKIDVNKRPIASTSPVALSSLDANSYISTDGSVINTSINSNGAIVQPASSDPAVASLNSLLVLERNKISPDSAQSLLEGQNQPSAGQNILPANFTQYAVLDKSQTDQKITANGTEQINLYTYTQKLPVNNTVLPVYGSYAQTQLNSENELTGIYTKIVNTENVLSGSISLEQAQNAALAATKNEYTDFSDFIICSQSKNNAEKVIHNAKLLGESDTDDINYEAYIINVCTPSEEGELLHTRQFISTQDGKVLSKESVVIHDLKNREIADCNNGPALTNCPVKRREGDSTSGISDVDKAYDIIGEIYDYVKNTFNRDSYNNNGSKQKVNVKVSSIEGIRCPNAAWSGSFMSICPGLVARDILAHEFGHGITMSTSRLLYRNTPSGAMHESMSDIYAMGFDNDDWTVGEDTTMGAIRNIADPTKSKPKQPDKLSSQYYRTGIEKHIAMGILSKAFYLMTEGGTFNDCSVGGVGMTKALQVMYKANAGGYIQSSAGFKDAYNGILRACDSLYGASSSDCANIDLAMQAVEMNEKTGASKTCTPTGGGTGGGGSAPTPTTGQNPNPTLDPRTAPTHQPIPTNPVPTGGRNTDPVPTVDQTRPTGGMGGHVTKFILGKACASPDITSAKFESAEYECSGGTSGTVSGEGTCLTEPELRQKAIEACRTSGGGDRENPNPREPRQEGAIQLTLHIKFPGIAKKPANKSTMKVRIGLSPIGQGSAEFKTVDFTAGDDGRWTATAGFTSARGNYCILVKGSHHKQSKICDEKPTETIPGSYYPSKTGIELSGAKDLDFTGIFMRAGDIVGANNGPQDGVVNSLDISFISTNLNSTDQSIVDKCDLNFDGACNGQDYASAIDTLSVRFDDDYIPY